MVTITGCQSSGKSIVAVAAAIAISRPDIISHDPHVQAHYERCLRNGCSPKLAESLALRQGPAIRTDVTLMQGHHNGNQFADSPWMGDFYKRQATNAGVSTAGKIYLSGLASYPGDPEAWVSDRGDVQRVLDKRGWSAQGAVNRKAEDVEVIAPPHPGLAPDIVEGEVRKVLAANPDAAPTPKERVELAEKIKEKQTPHWHKGKRK